jgi:hypothetical protein
MKPYRVHAAGASISGHAGDGAGDQLGAEGGGLDPLPPTLSTAISGGSPGWRSGVAEQDQSLLRHEGDVPPRGNALSSAVRRCSRTRAGRQRTTKPNEWR